MAEEKGEDGIDVELIIPDPDLIFQCAVANATLIYELRSMGERLYECWYYKPKIYPQKYEYGKIPLHILVRDYGSDSDRNLYKRYIKFYVTLMRGNVFTNEATDAYNFFTFDRGFQLLKKQQHSIIRPEYDKLLDDPEMRSLNEKTFQQSVDRGNQWATPAADSDDDANEFNAEKDIKAGAKKAKELSDKKARLAIEKAGKAAIKNAKAAATRAANAAKKADAKAKRAARRAAKKGIVDSKDNAKDEKDIKPRAKKVAIKIIKEEVVSEVSSSSDDNSADVVADLNNALLESETVDGKDNAEEFSAEDEKDIKPLKKTRTKIKRI